MTVSFSYIAPLTNVKVSYKDAYKKRAPTCGLESPLFVDLLLHHWVGGLCILGEVDFLSNSTETFKSNQNFAIGRSEKLHY